MKDSHETDWLLERLINMVEHGIEITVTLQISGFLVSGILIGGRKYFDALGAQFASALGGAEEVKKAFSKQGAEFYENEDDMAQQYARGHEMKLPPGYVYIHLRDARFFSSSRAIFDKGKGVLWRGRVCEVDGFFLGEMT